MTGSTTIGYTEFGVFANRPRPSEAYGEHFRGSGEIPFDFSNRCPQFGARGLFRPRTMLTGRLGENGSVGP